MQELALKAGTTDRIDLARDYHLAVDIAEREMLRHNSIDCPVFHHFTPGLYRREFHAPAGALVTSRIHKTEHPFVLLKGRATVYTETGPEELTAPHHGVTKPGTRRVILFHEASVWITFHPTALTDLDAIEALLIEPHREHLEGLEHPDGRAPVGMTAGGNYETAVLPGGSR
jgi:hypothetical protein